MADTSYESVFQADIVNQMQAQGWQLGNPSAYQAETALYEQDVLDFVQTTQPKEWEKFCRTFPIDLERHTSLISPVVTGKIDVRGWVAPVFDNAE